MASEPRDRSAPAKRRARARVGESEGRSPSDKTSPRAAAQSSRRPRRAPAAAARTRSGTRTAPELVEREPCGCRRTSPVRADPRSRRAAAGSCSGARWRSASSGCRPGARACGRSRGSSICENGTGDEVAALHRDHRRVAAREQELGRAVAEVARVLHVERDRVGAAQLVADVLGDDRRLDAQLPAAARWTCAFRISPMFTSAMRTWPCASRSTSLELREVVRVDVEHERLRRSPRRRRGGRSSGA